MSNPHQPQPGWPDPRANQPYQQPGPPPPGQYPNQGQQYPPPGQYPPAGQYPPPGQYPPQPYQQPYPTSSQDGQAHGPVKKPGAVIGAAVIAFVMAASQAFGVIVFLSLASNAVDGGLLTGLAIVNGIFAVVMVYGGVMVLLGKTSKILGFASIAIVVINVLSLIYALTQGGSPGFGFVGIVLPALVLSLLRQQKSRDYFAATGGSSF